jgi:hypothetical protein
MARRLSQLARLSANRLLVALLTLSFLAGHAALPTVTRVGKDRSQPYPCQDRPCGCASAEQCWRHCCCFTNREKLAWAREHGVTCPTYVVEAAEKEAGESCRTCCHRHSHGKPEKTERAERDDHHSLASTEAPHGPRGTLVVTDLLRQCGGVSLAWTILSAALPAPIRPGWTFDARVVGQVVEVPVVAPDVRPTPPVPPPRLTAFCG